jgi:hypothetical protein
MRIYVFKSDGQEGLRAYTDDVTGNKLPSQFSPWHKTGVVTPDASFPPPIARSQVEASINASGFQLWRLKPEKS